MKKVFILLVFIAEFSTLTFSQRIEYGLQFEGIGDNREFFSGASEPETILGSRLCFDLGTSLDSIHQIRAGISYFYEAGTTLLGQKLHPILYYSVEKGSLAFKMGAFMRNQTIDFPIAMISDLYGYYNPTVDGLYLRYHKKKLQTSLFVDWVSRIDSVNREQFMAGWSGNAHPGNFIFNGYWYLFHNRPNLSRPIGECIKDYTGACFMAGYNFASIIPLDILTVKTGALISFYRDRANGLVFEKAYSSYTELEAAYKGYGVKTLFNLGDKHHFSHGDQFFSNTKKYIRADLYFTPINFDRIKGRFTLSLHFVNSVIDNQQQFSLIYIFKDL